MSQNYTSVVDLAKKHKEQRYASAASSKESEGSPLSGERSTAETPPITEYAPAPEQEFLAPKPDTITLPPDLKKIGLKTQESQFAETLNRIKFPISDEQIMSDLKASPSEAKRWYATILLYILQRAHVTLVNVGSKVVRIFKSG